MMQPGLPWTGEYLSLHPYNVTGVKRQRNMAQMKEQSKTLQKELTDKEITSLSDAGFKNTGNQDAHRNNWVWSPNEGRMNAVQSEIKKNIQGTKREGKETRTQSNNLEQKEEMNIYPELIEKTRIQQNEEA